MSPLRSNPSSGHSLGKPGHAAHVEREAPLANPKEAERPLSKFRQLLLVAVLAIALSAASVLVQRTGPELAQYGNLCGPSSSDPCLEPVLKGGFPVAFLFDQPGVSVEHRLSLGEDVLHIGAFAANAILYFVGIMLAAFAMALPRKGVAR